MMRKYSTILLGCILIIATLLPVAGAFAQEEEDSATCEAFDGFEVTADYSSTEKFHEGDELTVTYPTDDFSLFIGGGEVGTAAAGETITYIFGSSNAQSIEVTSSTTGGTITFGCTPKGDDDDDEYDAVEVCHYPPGNPYAAHTITVGQAAVQAHLNHGDTIDACPPGVESREINYAIGMAYFTMEELGLMDLYGACVEDTCELLVRVDVTQFTMDPEGATFDENPDDAWHVVVYYLHEHPTQPGISIYQVNVFENDILIDDSLLFLVNEEGELIGWGTHNMWED